jgi:hypothetical protein
MNSKAAIAKQRPRTQIREDSPIDLRRPERDLDLYLRKSRALSSPPFEQKRGKRRDEEGKRRSERRWEGFWGWR